MWRLRLFLLGAAPAWAEPDFSEKYERDYKLFNSLNQYRPDNPLLPINEFNRSTSVQPMHTSR